MALVEHWRTDFDTDAKVASFFYSPAPGGLANIAGLRRVVQDGVSCIEINIGDEVPDASYFRTVGGGSLDAVDAYNRMVADLPNRSVGDILFCYSKDSTKHGKYEVLAGPSLSARLGSVAPRMMNDENHKRVVQIRLLLQSYSAAGDPISPGLHGYPDFAELNDSIGLPEEHNLSGWTMRWRMRAIGMSMGLKTKLFQHFQTRVPGPRVGSYNWGDGQGNGSVPYVNAGNVVTCISDDLGFGAGGLFAPNTVQYVADSGWVDVDIPLEPLWSYWLAMGGNPDKSGAEGGAYASFLRYVVANPAVWARNWTGNAYLCEGQFNPNPDSDLPVIPDSESVRGRLLVSSLCFLRAA